MNGRKSAGIEQYIGTRGRISENKVMEVAKKTEGRKAERQTKEKKITAQPRFELRAFAGRYAPLRTFQKRNKNRWEKRERDIHGSLRTCYRYTTELVKLHTVELHHRVPASSVRSPPAPRRVLAPNGNHPRQPPTYGLLLPPAYRYAAEHAAQPLDGPSLMNRKSNAVTQSFLLFC